MKNYAIEALIAHREPMILISRLIHFSETHATCEVDITKASAFYQPSIKGVHSYIGIEYMAQSIAAFAGAKAQEQGKPIEIGFLLGSRKYHCYQTSFQLNETYQISIEELYRESSGLSVFECAISLDERIVAQAKVNAYQPENPKEFLKEQQ
ncbi:hotdog family protein [Thalassotalea sp. 1_MG-2023]|uniref:hotdog family protein n=1 Tax=Thalassotalea sp. 1_MG-2023 TaxID=3062680 RepID=UPI0026E46CCC|nr:hotdog family protein [Thalassotalea sp. 1_MG-2023]MDO6426646.1 hotdog family protein [Thalassotalea sp. 1_MG-2023]